MVEKFRRKFQKIITQIFHVMWLPGIFVNNLRFFGLSTFKNPTTFKFHQFCLKKKNKKKHAKSYYDQEYVHLFMSKRKIKQKN